jgi:hypothetical protein
MEETPSKHETMEETPSTHEAIEKTPNTHNTHAAMEETQSKHDAMEESPSKHKAMEETPSTHVAMEETQGKHDAMEESPSKHKAMEETPTTHEAMEETPSTHKAMEETPNTHAAEEDTEIPKEEIPSIHEAEEEIEIPREEIPSKHDAENPLSPNNTVFVSCFNQMVDYMHNGESAQEPSTLFRSLVKERGLSPLKHASLSPSKQSSSSSNKVASRALNVTHEIEIPKGRFTGMVMQIRELSLSKKILLILDCNGLLWSSKRDPKLNHLPRSEGGIHYFDNNIYFERVGLHHFLRRCFERFDVAIWTCAAKRRTDAMVEKIFSRDEQYMFKFIWDQSYTRDSTVLRPDGNCNVMLKDLSMVWDTKYNGEYDDSNTVIIDDSPMKTFVNPTFTSLHPTSFKFGDCENTFLLYVLWPLLEKLSCATDVRRFLQINTPKWSTANAELDRASWPQIYESLKRKCNPINPSLHCYTILDLSKYEVTWEEKYKISKIPPKDARINKKEISRIATSLLPWYYKGPYSNDHLQFVNEVREVRDNTSKFALTSRSECTRDMLVDENGSKLTCSNMLCKLCRYNIGI